MTTIRERICALVLELDDFRVEEATSIAEALGGRDWSGYLAIVMDRQLPDGTLTDLLPRLRQLARDSPVIVVTGHDDVAGPIEAIRHRAVDYLLKPIDPDELRARVRRIAEHQRLEEARRESDRFARSVLDSLGANVAVLDQSGTILAVNQAWRDFAAANRAAGANVAEGADYLDTCARATGEGAETARAFAVGIHDVFAGRRVCFELEYPCHSPEERRWFVGRVTPFQGNGPSRAVVAHLDITKRKLAEEALCQSEERVRLLLNSTAEAIYGIDLDGLCTFTNAACLRILRYADNDDLLGKNLNSVLHQTRADGTPDGQEECPNLQAIRQGEQTHVDDKVFWRADGTSFPAEYWSYPVRQGDGAQVVGAVVTFIDITERKRAEEALRDSAARLHVLSRRVVEVQEAERRHIARELHDEIGQVLSAISVNLHAVKHVCDAAAVPRIEESIQIVDQATQQVRNLSLDLRPSMLDDLGLVSTVRWYADRQAQRAGFAVHFAVEFSAGRLPAELTIACFRVAQEALTNVARHARRKTSGSSCARATTTSI